MTRPPMTLIAAAVVTLLGLAGLVRGSLPQPGDDGSVSPGQSGPIVISGAYVREPANDVNAAAYLTGYDTAGTPDVLTRVVAGAGTVVSLHTDSNGSMQLSKDGVVVPAHGSVTLSPAIGHIMIEKLYGPLKPGQSVNMQLTFATAGIVLVTAPVIAISAPAPIPVPPK